MNEAVATIAKLSDCWRLRWWWPVFVFKCGYLCQLFRFHCLLGYTSTMMFLGGVYINKVMKFDMGSGERAINLRQEWLFVELRVRSSVKLLRWVIQGDWFRDCVKMGCRFGPFNQQKWLRGHEAEDSSYAIRWVFSAIYKDEFSVLEVLIHQK